MESFPDFRQIYQSNELFPLFRNRVMDEDRVDFGEYLRQLDIDPMDANPINILAVTGGKRQTDNLQVFPKIDRQTDGRFCCRFFIHGNRYANDSAQARYGLLKAGDLLRIALELNNPATRVALQLQTSDYHMIGWAPRYLIGDLKKAIDDSPEAVVGKVVKVNPAPAPANQRVLVELTGRLPEGHSPMSGTDFQLISASFIS